MTMKFLILLAIAAVFMPKVFGADVDCKKHPPFLHPAGCCDLPDLITDEIKEKCKEFTKPRDRELGPIPNDSQKSSSVESAGGKQQPPQGPNGGRAPYWAHMSPCFMSCFMNQTGIMQDGKLNENNLSSYLKIALKNSTDMIPAIETSFKTCSAKQAEMMKKFKDSMEKRKQAANNRQQQQDNNKSQQDRMMRPPRCSHSELHLMACANMETFMNCPSSKWSDTQDCNNLRDYMKKCKPKMDDESNSTEEKM